MVDDMCYSDISPYGGEIETPNLASLGTSGLRFTRFHNSASGGPTSGVNFAVSPGSPPNDITATIGSTEADGTGKLFGRLKATE